MNMSCRILDDLCNIFFFLQKLDYLKIYIMVTTLANNVLNKTLRNYL